jgi:hypothetical protein
MSPLSVIIFFAIPIAPNPSAFLKHSESRIYSPAFLEVIHTQPEEIARLQQAESLAKKALEAVKPGLGGAVTSDLKVRSIHAISFAF